MKYTFWLIYLVFFTLTSFTVSAGDKSRLAYEEIESAEMTSEEKRRSEVWISTEFRQGNFLIYDCKKRHFTCVNDEGYLKCGNKREYSYKKRKLNLQCAPLKEYINQKRCFKAVYNMVHSIKSKKFCLNNRI